MTITPFRRRATPLAALAVSLVAAITPASAQNAGANDPLPVRAVTLFSSGVSYTVREGEVSGDALVPLSFRTAQINDILKSLVLLDERGTVQPAVYGAKDPIGRTLQSFAVDVTQPLSRAELLNRMRGARVSVETVTDGKVSSVTGQIVGVESKVVPADGGRTAVIEYLTVLGDAGLQSVRLDDVRTIKLLDERLNREFREALSLLSAGADDRRRPVTLRFSGSGRRKVRVGYVSEAPLWKISYRLLLGGSAAAGADGKPAASDAAAKPYMQGWALVENTTEDDWNNVRLSLVSGRPVSFIQDLYQPLYLPRPVVPLDVVASPYPQVAAGALEEAERNAPAPTAAPAPPARPNMVGRMSRTEGKAVNGATGGGLGGGAGLATGAGESAFGVADADGLRASLAAQATGEKAGELFRYNITTPVTLPRQQAAMIPVVAQDITGAKVSLYNADTGPRFPLNAVRLKNDTALHLKAGPVTVFDDGTYAGDARMEDVPPGDSRLITYAVDLGVEGERQQPTFARTETTLAIRRGILTTSRRERTETAYTLKNRADKPRLVLVEHPFSPDFKLIAPEQAAERTPDRYRFEVAVAPGKTETLKVVTERPVSQTVALFNMDVSTLQFYVNQREIPESVKNALREILSRRRRVQELQAQAVTAENEIKAIEQDQERVRKNMGALDRASALYRRYVTQLDEQETRMQNLRKEATRLRGAASEAERDLRAYLDTLDVTG